MKNPKKIACITLGGEGCNPVDHGLMVALISVVAIASVELLRDQINAAFKQLVTVIDSVGG